jgi:tetratricopeptide (TPR) repeat protein
MLKRAIFAVACLLVASAAVAQITDTPEQRCARAVGDDSIAACSDVIGIGEGGAAIEWAYVARAHAYESQQLYTSAISDLNDALALKKKDPALLDERARDDVAVGNYADAVGDYDTLIDLKPSTDAYAARCRVRAIANIDLDDAADDCNDALKLSPTDGAALEARCFVNVRKAAWAAAIADCSAALNADWKMASALYLRGIAKMKSGDAKGADGDLAAAQTLDPRIAETFETYGIKP